MPVAIQNAVYDGFMNQAGGADGGRLAHLIDKEQYVEGENLICRGGGVGTRFPLRQLTFTHENPNLTYDADGTFVSDDGPVSQSLTTFLLGTVQEVSYYSPSKGKEFLVASINGRLFRIAIGETTALVREVALERRNRKTIPINYHLQADIYHITQDGEAKPIIFDGVKARRAEADEIFTGLMMGTGMGRIVLVGVDGLIYFGDIYDATAKRGADMLKFTETLFLNEGFPTKLPAFMGKPTAVKFLPLQDTATGVGECLVWGVNGCESFYLSIPRENWKDSPFQRTALIGMGNRGHRNVTAINQDLWFHSDDGWRSYRQARATQTDWAQIPLSTNVRKWTDTETPHLLDYGSSVAFNNRLLMTTTPYYNNGRINHNGALSLDFDVLSSFGQTTKPAWDGHWTERTATPLLGLRAVQFVEGQFAGKQRAFMFVLERFENGDHNAIWEIMPEPVGQDTFGPITARWRGRSMDFNSPTNEKSLYQGNLWIENVSQSTTFAPTFRADQVPSFSPWGDPFTVDPSDAAEGDANIVTPGYAVRVDLPKPSDDANESNIERLLRRGYEFQTEIKFTGRANIRKHRAVAIEELEHVPAQV